MATNNVSFDDFKKLDIRIGTVKEAVVPKWSHWVMKLKVDFGEKIGEKIIFAGIMHFYKSEDLVGKQFPFVVNMSPKKMGPEGDKSEGMMLAVGAKLVEPVVVEGEEVEEKPVLFSLHGEVENGTKVR